MLQIQEEAASPTIDNMQLSLWDLAVKGGWLMIPLVLLWVIGLYIFFERYLSIRKASRVDGNFMNRIRELVIDDKLDAARELCQKTDIPVARMVGKGIDRIGRPIADLNTAIENVGNLEVAKLERGLPMRRANDWFFGHSRWHDSGILRHVDGRK